MTLRYYHGINSVRNSPLLEVENRLINWLKSDGMRMDALKVARGLNLSDWCLAAGFVRNLVWDKLHQYKTATPLNDIDLIYFDAADISEEKDRAIESKLSQISKLPWSVKNQARMHQRNNDKPYLSSEDAMRYWPEMETAIGIRLNCNDELKIIAPFGLEALFNKTITMNNFRPKPDVFKHRLETRSWLTHWPDLIIHTKKIRYIQ